jgi:hypothetical protein
VCSLKAASVIDTEEYITTSYSRGFPVGYSDTNKNHYLCVVARLSRVCARNLSSCLNRRFPRERE